nr:MAG TPA: hypothetical protein [Caudoviricetes sp.]
MNKLLAYAQILINGFVCMISVVRLKTRGKNMFLNEQIMV